MATKHVHETKAAQSVGAWVILDKEGRETARVLAYFGNSGRVLVNVNNFGPDNPDAEDRARSFQAASAGGYGYDKFTAALVGLTVCGVKMVDNSWPAEKEGLPNDAPDVRGANWRDGVYQSYFVEPGLDRLTALGFRVIRAI